jgi:DNA processing protein
VYGIDGAAHRGALAAGGPTFAVLSWGVDYGYPSGHVGLLREIARDDAPGTPLARLPARYR